MKQVKMRLNKFLSTSGVCSRREADSLIADKRVKIDGEVAKLGDQVDPQTDRVEIDGTAIKPQRESCFVYYALNKPKRIISTSRDEKNRQNVTDLVPKEPRVYPVGRLDKDSEGLIVLTNDGDFANEMMHPSHDIEKEYSVKFKNQNAKSKISDQELGTIAHKFKQGLHIESKLMKAIVIEKPVIRDACYEARLILNTGYNRQIRKMFAKIGFEVVKLTRIRIGNLKLSELKIKPGEFKKINKKLLIASREK